MTQTLKDIIIVNVMATYRSTRVLPVALIIIIIVIAIVGLTYVARLLFFSDNSGVLSQADTSQAALTSTSADRAVSMTVRGAIVADEDFRTYQIKVTPNGRILTIYAGYQNQPIDNITIGNNIPAYEQFVYALNRAKLMNNDEAIGDSNDTRGVCPTGKLYEFQIIKADKSVKKLWTTSCSNARGSLGLNVSTFTNLFIDQIPGAQTKIGSIWR